VVLGTGAGKSLCFLLLVAAAGGLSYTVVITPLVALVADLQARYRRLRIPSLVWNAASPFESASLVFTTPEASTTVSFQAFLNQ
jgi:superfamily II DNA helicase RecQ